MCFFAFTSLYLDQLHQDLQYKDFYVGFGAFCGILLACFRLHLSGSEALILMTVKYMTVGTAFSLIIRASTYRWSRSSENHDNPKDLGLEKEPREALPEVTEKS